MRRLHPPLLAGLLALLLLVGAGACQLGGGPGPSSQLSGRIALPKNAELWVLRLGPDRQESRVAPLTDPDAAVTGAAWSPDGTEIVYSELSKKPGARQSGADLLAVRGEGGTPRVFVDRGDPPTILETPVWATSGQVYYVSRRLVGNQDKLEILRTREGGTPEVLVADARSPGVFPDESAVVYLRTNDFRDEMWKHPLGGSGQPCLLLPSTAFTLLGVPRVSPDGTKIAFAASGDPGPTKGGTCGAQSSASVRSTEAAAPLGGLVEWLSLGPRTAYAHGAPWDLWTIDADGSGLKKVATLKEDEPSVAWSPDGTALAALGVLALYGIDAESGQVQRLVEPGTYGGVDWAR